MDDEDRSRLSRSWRDERAAIHLAGECCDVGGFLAGRSSLRPFETRRWAASQAAAWFIRSVTSAWTWRRFSMAEFHPFSVVLGEEDLMVTDCYVDPGPSLHDEPGCCADPDAKTAQHQSLTWHHGLGAVVTALAQAGLKTGFLHGHAYTLRARSLRTPP